LSVQCLSPVMMPSLSLHPLNLSCSSLFLRPQRRIKSSNTFLTESSFTSSALSKSVVKTTVPAPSLSSRTNPSLKERESFYASQINDMSWMGNFQRSVEESLAEGEREGKVEEIQRELFNTVEALEGERMETKRVKGEVRLDEERSDEMITTSQGAKFTHARTTLQDAPPPQPTL